jgi:hypothetical protein
MRGELVAINFKKETVVEGEPDTSNGLGHG